MRMKRNEDEISSKLSSELIKSLPPQKHQWQQQQQLVVISSYVVSFWLKSVVWFLLRFWFFLLVSKAHYCPDSCIFAIFNKHTHTHTYREILMEFINLNTELSHFEYSWRINCILCGFYIHSVLFGSRVYSDAVNTFNSNKLLQFMFKIDGIICCWSLFSLYSNGNDFFLRCFVLFDCNFCDTLYHT